MKKAALFLALIVIFGGLTAFAFFSNLRNGKATGSPNSAKCQVTENCQVTCEDQSKITEKTQTLPPCCQQEGNRKP